MWTCVIQEVMAEIEVQEDHNALGACTENDTFEKLCWLFGGCNYLERMRLQVWCPWWEALEWWKSMQ